MLNNNTSALGLIFPNTYDAIVPELTNVRLMASIPFASRYRLIDFILSGMSNSGIDNISLLVNKNYHSLMDHLGSGREWDLVRKNGGLTLSGDLEILQNSLFGAHVHGGDGVVQNEDGGILHQRPRDGDALLLAA